MFQNLHNWEFYAYCPVCNKFETQADSIADARAKIEQHEQECHKGKPVGTFGKQKVNKS